MKRAAIELEPAAEGRWDQLAVVGVGAVEAAAGEHLIGGEHHHLPPLAEEAEGLLGTRPESSRSSSRRERAGTVTEKPSSPASGSGAGAGFDGVGETLHRQAVAVGGGALQTLAVEAQVDAGEQLLVLVRRCWRTGWPAGP